MSESYTTSFTVHQNPEDVFHAINDVRGWWDGEIEGTADSLGAEFTYRHGALHYSKQKVTEFVPGKKVVWLVTEADITFVTDRTEWKDTRVVFDIAEKDGKTEVTFTHEGLVPQFECYDGCSDAWGYYVKDSLPKFIAKSRSEVGS
ncbi:SRPBCC domain-containing protein [Solwaraspora sp. WMMD792]|uniref:SRPBCC family protein n=1 Tax=unclassified Solwaraspora TaxID=2627926 RepID=UPI002416D8C3|nr:SRPBCC domain-containing protein [Solwaraspora sp. WMMD792]MDG4772680.1 SRPBCC domain-containing protein [Solwaraspora sp. WMMD792]